jgi:hypothetical protein
MERQTGEEKQSGTVATRGSESAVEHLVSGQTVTWTEMTARKRGSFRLSTKTGKVVKDCGQMVVVRYRGKEMTILRSRLRTEDQRTELTEFVMEMGQSV